MDSDWVTVGIITAPHGVKGAVKVLPTTDFPDRFSKTESVYVFAKGVRRQYPIRSASAMYRGRVTLQLVGVDNREEAEALKGSALQVHKDHVLPLPDGRYYVFDLIGCDVITLTGETIGTLMDVIETGANDVYAVEDDDGNEWLIPAIKSVVKDVRIEEKTVVIDPIPGLIGDD